MTHMGFKKRSFSVIWYQVPLGFTLIEIIMTVVVLSIVGMVLASAFLAGSQALIQGLDSDKTITPMAAGLSRLEKDSREVRTLKDVTTASSTQFRFLDLDFNDVNYQYSSGTLSRNSNALVTGITSFSFTYKDINETTIATPAVSPNPTDIRYVQVQVTVVSGSISKTMRTTICPRTFRS